MAIQQTPGGAVVVTGSDITVYQALAVKHGLKACKIGMRAGKAYTPTNLMRMVEKITGQKFKLRQYDAAIAAVETWIAGRREREYVAGQFLSEWRDVGASAVDVHANGNVTLHLVDKPSMEFTVVEGDPDLKGWRKWSADNGDAFTVMLSHEEYPLLVASQ